VIAIDPKPSRLFSARWPFIVVAILATHTTAMIMAVTIFVRHHNNDVIPDFYDKAVHWDQIKAAQQHDAATHPNDQDAMP